jgi:hypothetical protein
MAIPKLETDVQIVSKIPDYPGSEGGLSPDAFKAKFDEAPQIIKDFINDVLIAELNTLVDVQALLINILDSTLTLSDKAANAKATGDELRKKLDKSGGTMVGPINMSGRKLEKVGNPTEPTDAVNKAYVDEKRKTFSVNVPVSGWTGEGPYIQTVAVAGILATDAPHYGPVYAEEQETRLAQKEAFAMVDELETIDGFVTLTCFEDKPEADLSIQMEVNR